MPDDEANDDEVTEGGEGIDPRQDLARAMHQALDAIDCAIEKTRAAADHADDAYGDPNPVSGELEDLLGMLRIWYAAASMVLEDVQEDQ